MTDFSEAKVARGKTGNGTPGSFATKQNTEPDPAVTLATAPPITADEARVAINTSFPTPQANNLAKVLSTVEAVARGENTVEAAAVALDHDRSEGGFYTGAAGLLGLLERENGIYELTPLGTRVLDMDSLEQRSEALRTLAEASPGVVAYRKGNIKAVTDYLDGEADLSELTTKRRVSTVEAWVNTIDERAILGVSYEPSRKSGADRTEKTLTICPECTMAVSNTMYCEECQIQY